MLCNYLLKLVSYSFFCKFKKVIESPKPKNASSGIMLMLFDRISRCLNRCNGRKASLGIMCKSLSPKRKYCKFSIKNRKTKYIKQKVKL